MFERYQFAADHSDLRFLSLKTFLRFWDQITLFSVFSPEKHVFVYLQLNWAVLSFITPFLKSLVVPVIWLALIDAIYSRIAPIFCFKSHLLPSQLGSYTKKKNNLSDFKTCLKLPITLQENERQRVSCGKFCNFCFQNSYFFPTQKWMNLISDRLSTASIKYLNWPSPVFGRFQNGCNKVVIEPRVVQFWSEIILVISNRTHAAR